MWLDELHPTQVITDAGLSRKIKEWENEGEIIFHYLPDIKHSVLIQPLFQFMDLLCNKGYLNEIAERKWVRTETIL
jgi:competence protein CoiA